MDLQLTSTTPHTLEVIQNLWDNDTTCIVLLYDGRNDHRSPALTADEARRLGHELIAMADAPPIVADEHPATRRRHLRSVDALINAALYEEIARAMAEDVISGRHVHNVETDEVIDASVITDADREAAIAAYQRLILKNVGA